MNREQRRRQQRQDAALIVGDGIVATGLGQRYEAIPHAELPTKVPGKHRWIATAGYVMTEPQVAAADDADTIKFLDQENLFLLAIGCFDCEQPLGQIEFGSTCPAPGD